MAAAVVRRTGLLLLALAVPGAFVAGWLARDWPMASKASAAPAKAQNPPSDPPKPPPEADAAKRLAPLTLMQSEAQLGDLEEEGTIHLRFSAPLDPLQALPAVEVAPAIPRMAVAVSGESLVLRGPLPAGASCTIKVPATLRALDGRLLGKEAQTEVVIPGRGAAFTLPASCGMLSPAGHLALEAKAVGIGKVRVRVHRVLARHLMWALRGREDFEVAREEASADFEVPGDPSEPQNLLIGLRRLLAGKDGAVKPGLYRVHILTQPLAPDAAAEASEETDAPEGDAADATDAPVEAVELAEGASGEAGWNGPRDSAVVAVGDLALVAERGAEKLSVFAANVSDGKPAEGVAWKLLAQNGETLAEAQGDPSGFAELRLPKGLSVAKDGGARLLLATRGEETAWLELDRHGAVPDQLSGAGRAAPRALDASVYAERGAYLPGETMHLSALVRGKHGETPPAGLPLEMALFRPDGFEVAKQAVKVEGAQGFLHADFTPDAASPRGLWRAELRVPGKKGLALGQTSFLFDLFEPAKVEVKAKALFERVGPGDAAQVKAQAKWLYGAPAEGLSARVEGMARREAFVSKALPDFTFPDWQAGRTLALTPATGTFDAKGEAQVAADLSALTSKAQTPGRWSIAGSVAALEDSGRATSGAFAMTVDTASCFIGVKGLAFSVSPGRVPLELALRDGEDKPASAVRVAAVLVRKDWDWRLSEHRGVKRWESVVKETEVWRGEAVPDAAGRAKIEMPVAENGSYALRLTAQGHAPGVAASEEVVAVARAAQNFEVWHGAGQAPGARPEAPAEVTMTLDKKAYLPGETARVSLNGAFDGLLMIAVEGEDILWRKVLPRDPAADASTLRRTVEIPVDAAWRGSVVVRAWVIRPLDPKRDAWLPLRAGGAAQLVVDPAAHALPLSIQTPAEGAPGATIPVSVKAVPGAGVHLFMVDEGLLAVTDFKRPDPLAWFLAPRRPLMEAMDHYDDLLPDYLRAKSFARIGGDAGGEEDGGLGLRLGAVDLRGVDPHAVYFAKAEVAGPDGMVRAHVPLPENPTRVRVMAVGADHDRYGSAEAAVPVRTEWQAMAAAPKVVAPGDAFVVPVRVIHRGKEQAQVGVEVVAPEGFKVEGEAKKMLTAPADGTVATEFRLVATGVTEMKGEMTVKVGAASTRVPLSLRPAALLGSAGSVVRLEPGQKLRLDPAAGFVGASEWKLSVRPSPLVACAPVVAGLLDYPHGCGEQTSSSLGAVASGGLALAEEDSRKAVARHMIAHGVARLAAMQAGDGGMPYWPGGAGEPWVSAHAALALGQAKAAGVEVPEVLSERLLDFLVRNLNGDDGDFSADQRALALRAMAGLDSPKNRGLLARAEALLAKSGGDLTQEGRAQLAITLASAGRRDLAVKALGSLESVQAGASRRVVNGCGSASALAATLEAAVALDLSAKDALAMKLLAMQAPPGSWWGAGWGATSADAAAVRALAAWEREAPPSQGKPASASLRKPVVALHASLFKMPAPGASWEASALGKDPLELENTGDAPAFVAFSARGWRAPGTQEASHGLRLSRKFLTPGGDTLDVKRLHPGDLVVLETTVALTAESGTDAATRLALTVDLPGGLTPENARLATASAVAQEAQNHLRQEAGDGRMVVFGSATRSDPLVSRLLLRVTSKGRFALGPASAEDMDDPTLCGVDAGGEGVEVK